MSETRLFAYGTLMFPEVREALLGTALDSEQVVLRGFARYTVRHPGWAPFPAIVAEPGAAVSGLLVFDLDAVAMATLDRFENVDNGLYARTALTVADEAGRSRSAMGYVAGSVLVPHLRGPWDPELFRHRGLEAFMKRVFGRSCI